MVKGRLPDRPVGVRKSWKLASTDPQIVDARLRERCRFNLPDNGAPVAAQEWRERKGAPRRLIVVYANDRYVSLALRRDGRTILSMRGGA